METKLSTKLQQYFVFFPFSLAFLVLFFNKLNEVNPATIVEGLYGLSEDLSKIGLSTQVTNLSTLIILISVFVKGQNPNVYKWPEAESNCRPLVFQIWANLLTLANYN